MVPVAHTQALVQATWLNSFVVCAAYLFVVRSVAPGFGCLDLSNLLVRTHLSTLRSFLFSPLLLVALTFAACLEPTGPLELRSILHLGTPV